MLEKTLILSFNFPPTIGGIETYSRELFYYYRNHDNVKLHSPPKKISNKPFIRGVELIYFIVKSFLKFRNNKFQLIQVTSFNLWIFCYLYSLFNKETKFLINIWGLEFAYENKKGLLPKIYRVIFINKKILRKDSFHYLVSSEASKKLLMKSDLKEENITLIKLGVYKKDIVNCVQSIDLDDKYFLFVGRLIKRKGLSWFSQNILPKFPNYKLKVVGPLGEKEESLVLSSNNVEYLGVVDNNELKLLRQGATICVVPNIFLDKDDDFEAFCFVTIESVASGSVVVASDYQGISEALLHGKIGNLANPSDIDSWVENIKEITSLKSIDRNKLINERMEILKKELTWEILFKQTNNLHKDILLKAKN